MANERIELDVAVLCPLHQAVQLSIQPLELFVRARDDVVLFHNCHLGLACGGDKRVCGNFSVTLIVRPHTLCARPRAPYAEVCRVAQRPKPA